MVFVAAAGINTQATEWAGLSFVIGVLRNTIDKVLVSDALKICYG